MIGIDNPTTLEGEIKKLEFMELSKAIKKKVRFSDERLFRRAEGFSAEFFRQTHFGRL